MGEKKRPWMWALFSLGKCLSFTHSSPSCVRLFAIPWTGAHQAPLSMGFSRQEYWSTGSHFLLQGILPTQRSLPLLRCRRILYPWANREAPLGHSFPICPAVGSRVGPEGPSWLFALLFWDLRRARRPALRPATTFQRSVGPRRAKTPRQPEPHRSAPAPRGSQARLFWASFTAPASLSSPVPGSYESP